MGRLVLAPIALLVALAVAPSSASAQGRFSLGAFVGREFDTQDDWILFGAQARIGLPRSSVAVNPRFGYHPFDGGSIIQLDLNAIYDFELAKPGTIRPYLGGGVGIIRQSIDIGTASESETKLGANFVTGLRLMLAGSKLSPFLHTQYTAAKNLANSYTLSVGVDYRLK